MMMESVTRIILKSYTAVLSICLDSMQCLTGVESTKDFNNISRRKYKFGN